MPKETNTFKKTSPNANTNEYYVYILLCADNTLYTGITNNLERRIEAHNNGSGAKYTRGRRPVTLLYSESSGDKSEALRREKAIKKLSKAQKLDLIKDNTCVIGDV